MLMCCFRKIVRHVQWIQRPGIILGFSQPLTAMERSENVHGLMLTSPNIYATTTTKYVYQKPLKYGYLHNMDKKQWSQWCLLQRLHCITNF